MGRKCHGRRSHGCKCHVDSGCVPHYNADSRYESKRHAPVQTDDN